MAGKAAL